jgi:hypothetical protein
VFFDNPVGPIKSVTVAPISANSSCITAMIFSSLSGTSAAGEHLADGRITALDDEGLPLGSEAKSILCPSGPSLGPGRVYRLLVWSARDVVL